MSISIEITFYMWLVLPWILLHPSSDPLTRSSLGVLAEQSLTPRSILPPLMCSSPVWWGLWLDKDVGNIISCFRFYVAFSASPWAISWPIVMRLLNWSCLADIFRFGLMAHWYWYSIYQFAAGIQWLWGHFMNQPAIEIDHLIGQHNCSLYNSNMEIVWPISLLFCTRA